MSEAATAENPRAVPGGNNPPSPVMPVAPDVETIEAAIRGGEHAKFLKDADEWIESVKRAPAVIENDKQAEAFAKTISELIKARTNAEKYHASIKAPWFKITKAIDAVFLAGVKNRAEAAEKIMVQRQKVWITKVEEAKRKAEREKARLAQIEADRLRDEEAAKLREAEKAMDAGDMAGAESIMAEAVEANTAAAEQEQTAAVATDKAEGKTADLVREHHSVGVTTSARTFWACELLPRAALSPSQQLQFWNTLAPYLGPDVLQKAANAATKAGIRECPGLRIYSDFNPINR